MAEGNNEPNVLELHLLKSFDKESVAKLLGKKNVETQFDEGKAVPAAKKLRMSEEGGENACESKISKLELQVKTERSHRVYYEEKSQKLARNLKKAEDVIVSLKKKLREGSDEHNSLKLNHIKSKLLLRIGDIEKDTVELKGLVADEIKNVVDIKTPLEKVSKLVEFLQSELDARDKKIKEFERALAMRDKIVKESAKERSSSNPGDGLGEDSSVEAEAVSKKFETNLSLENDELRAKVVEHQTNITELTRDLEMCNKKIVKLKDKKSKLGLDYDDLERYLTKIEGKLEKKSAKCEQLHSENDLFKIQIESLNNLNENMLEQTKVLKEESLLLKDSITQKDEKLARVESQLRMSKEELKQGVFRSFQVKEEEMIKELSLSKHELQYANLKIKDLLHSKHKLSIKVEDLKLENYALVRSQKAELKKVKKIHEDTCLEMSNELLLCKKGESVEDNNNIREKNFLETLANVKEAEGQCVKKCQHADADTAISVIAAVVDELFVKAIDSLAK